ncbi:PAAR domain-containing protein [Dyella flava]|uniref:PAAR domain-containing protein n=1 Tax=Dyella flava TaxID=1920170 RepID=A0ABS2K1X4_9GAMM|nr:PAAR domain-containing protein [Dyella flava]MBM7125223.1 PAAR domain-containing protein [Dyella flava]GLQ50734.1 hypothetical protein GCM10010872_21830 [Dyella flava]
MKVPACLGDPTSHGGKIITASSSYVFHSRKAAVLDDLVSCPIHGDNPIVESGDGFSDEGRSLVVSGCRSRCGAVVLPGDAGVTIR